MNQWTWISIIAGLVITNAVCVFLLFREKKARQRIDKDMSKLKYELSLKSIQMLERIEKLQEENDLLKSRSE